MYNDQEIIKLINSTSKPTKFAAESCNKLVRAMESDAQPVEDSLAAAVNKVLVDFIIREEVAKTIPSAKDLEEFTARCTKKELPTEVVADLWPIYQSALTSTESAEEDDVSDEDFATWKADPVTAFYDDENFQDKLYDLIIDSLGAGKLEQNTQAGTGSMWFYPEESDVPGHYEWDYQKEENEVIDQLSRAATWNDFATAMKEFYSSVSVFVEDEDEESAEESCSKSRKK